MKNYLLLTLILIGLFPCRLYAGAYVMPVTTYVRAGTNFVIQEIIAWDEEPDTPNPCYGISACTIGPDVLYATHPPGLRGSCNSRNCLVIGGMKTRQQVAEAYKRRFGIPYRVTAFSINAEEATCVGLFYTTHTPVGGVEDAIQWPGSTCGKLPPVNQSCSVSLPASVDFASLPASKIDGKTRTITGHVSCRRAGEVLLYGRSRTGERNVMLSDDRQLYASLNINNQDAWRGVNIHATGQNISEPFSFTVMLHTNGEVSAGQYQGIAIALLAYP
ncbi:hypothetical protein BL250_15120 [Erwinia sp. OLTSP20]|uniref:MrpH family fimbial adhesin n=1 Tax=unclassified Erwinia TaxID=2622719 RepID=UPI000C19A573|nr:MULTISPECIES: hypothetical protein [unclassified Erwinia]PIJ48168.1 hypothetical protein BV501_18120 [Erwinia sp. OAMSP11]PIJ67067.1 hypothetical protein BK416_17160 [Erwinia sp. OLSSP12]PIJ78374.1 hypothetical protein BLD47_17290 [Erwinia sp. OLCASP19]PIJ79125.1 hypothetical protein BLD46_17350 [Erwinia sp. OLMTSP26]PIJ79982.1 hypothetical protein BLD49_17300 [Erwinia sp. OLMDSP33]